MSRISLTPVPRRGFRSRVSRLISESRPSNPGIISLLLVVALATPMVLVVPQHRVSAAAKPMMTAPSSAPPEPFLIHAPAYTAATLDRNNFSLQCS